MALLGQAALAMWWNMAPALQREFQDWHSHEHVPERLGIPGFLRASRWRDAGGGPGFFVLYELETFGTLVCPEYLARLDAPTPWSMKLMPHHADMVRSQARVLHSRGAATAAHALTARLAPRPGMEAALGNALQALAGALVLRPGLVGAHLLQTSTPAIPLTTEQKIRGGTDTAADWIFIVTGYDADALTELQGAQLGPEAMAAAGAAPDAVLGRYSLALTMVPGDPA